MKQRVAIEPIEAAINVIMAFNALDLSQITLTENGVPLNIPDEIIREYRYTG